MKDLAKVGWKTAPLGDVTTVINGGTPKSKVAEFWSGDVQWLTPKDMGQMKARAISETPRTITKAGLDGSSARLIPADSVILSTRAPIGHLAINIVPMAFNQGCRGIIPGEELDPVYLFHFLDMSRDLLNSLGTGTTFKELSATNLKTVTIPFPPLEEQQKIVAVLDEAFEGLARARAQAEANLADAEMIAARSLDVMLEDLSVQNGRITIDGIAAVKGGKRLPKGSKTDPVPTPYPYISVKDLTEVGTVSTENLGYISEQVQRGIARYTISSRDVYISIAGTIGKSGIVPDDLDGANLTENAAKLVLVGGWSNEYVYWCTRSTDFATQTLSQTRVAAQPKLALQRLGAITIPKATEVEQISLCEKMNALRETRSELVAMYTRKTQDLDDLRQSLLQKAFAGELT